MTTSFIGYANDKQIRYSSSSGGIITAVIKYLFEAKRIDSFLGCTFNVEKCCYEPTLIHSYADYELAGSVYQEMDLIPFVKEHLAEIKKTILVVCSPCLVKAFRNILKKNGLEAIIIDYFCSGQTTIEGTYCYYRFMNIAKKDVLNIRYRGNGWPNGIEITLRSGEMIRRANYSEPWSTIHGSELFRPKRCFYCKNVESEHADISVGDPWLKEYIDTDTIGSSLFLVHSALGQSIVQEMLSNNKIVVKSVDYELFEKSQRPSLRRKSMVSDMKSYYDLVIKIINIKSYSTWAKKNRKNMKRHIWIMNHIVRPYSSMKKMSKFGIFKKIVGKIKSGGARIYWKKKIGSIGENWYKGEHVTMQNPHCLFFGNNVGIGKYTYFMPCCNFLGTEYHPKITVGDGTWIGIRNSFAAIHGITIGKNVLFAGYVHVTDHSHGYEDITKPISKQPLISKGPVVIEDNCWLGFNSEILSGVHIGRNSVVAAHAVVTKDIPPYSIVAGNPARIVKQYNFETHEWEKYK